MLTYVALITAAIVCCITCSSRQAVRAMARHHAHDARLRCHIRQIAERIDFEFDDAKSRAKKAKHGIDFVDAQRLWLDDRLLEVLARKVDEPRWVIIGRIAGVHWSAVITYRDGRVRLISVRRSRAEEVTLYES